MKKLSLCFVVSLGIFGFAIKGTAELPRTFGLHPDAMHDALGKVVHGHTQMILPLQQLNAEADKLLKLTPASVMDKTKVAASGDRHDYFSFAPYFWPDPSKPDGRPYIRRDGDVNPESKQGTDSAAFARTCNAVETLGLAFQLTGGERRERYARQAATLARVWFLDPATRMNPNLEHAQAIPGLNNGRGIGILEARHLVNLTDGLALLAGSPEWTTKDAVELKAWLTAYYDWLITSQHGRDEAAAENNHGSWYDVQAVGLALVLGRTDDAKKILTTAQVKRIARQIEPDGRQPLELERTKSLDYACFNLEALVTLARLGESVGVDLWAFSTADGRSLRAALAYLAPYADPAKVWPKEDLKAADRARILPLLVEALRHGEEARWREPLTKFGGKPAVGEHWRLWMIDER